MITEINVGKRHLAVACDSQRDYPHVDRAGRLYAVNVRGTCLALRERCHNSFKIQNLESACHTFWAILSTVLHGRPPALSCFYKMTPGALWSGIQGPVSTAELPREALIISDIGRIAIFAQKGEIKAPNTIQAIWRDFGDFHSICLFIYLHRRGLANLFCKGESVGTEIA